MTIFYGLLAFAAVWALFSISTALYDVAVIGFEHKDDAQRLLDVEQLQRLNDE